jgi:hypothetical protein
MAMLIIQTTVSFRQYKWNKEAVAFVMFGIYLGDGNLVDVARHRQACTRAPRALWAYRSPRV